MKNPIRADVLVFAPHPDDGEIFCGGTIAALSAKGYRVGLIDMTKGELGSQGTVQQRAAEAKKSDRILKLSFRINLGLKDGSLSDMSIAANLRAVVAAVRKAKPAIVIAPYWEDRHPDHVGAGQLLTKAVFLAGLRKYSLKGTEYHAITQCLFYPTRVNVEPSILVDTSKHFASKLAAIKVYHSQVDRDQKLSKQGIKTLVSSPLAISSMEHRDGFYGSMIGVRYAEPFIIRNAISVDDPVKFFSSRPLGEALFLNR